MRQTPHHPRQRVPAGLPHVTMTAHFLPQIIMLIQTPCQPICRPRRRRRRPFRPRNATSDGVRRRFVGPASGISACAHISVTRVPATRVSHPRRRRRRRTSGSHVPARRPRATAAARRRHPPTSRGGTSSGASPRVAARGRVGTKSGDSLTRPRTHVEYAVRRL